ncbi:hypothetical protein V1527DRAFT_167402 [Lipomyces starkeyi]
MEWGKIRNGPQSANQQSGSRLTRCVHCENCEVRAAGHKILYEVIEEYKSCRSQLSRVVHDTCYLLLSLSASGIVQAERVCRVLDPWTRRRRVLRRGKECLLTRLECGLVCPCVCETREPLRPPDPSHSSVAATPARSPLHHCSSSISSLLSCSSSPLLHFSSKAKGFHSFDLYCCACAFHPLSTCALSESTTRSLIPLLPFFLLASFFRYYFLFAC